MPSDLRAIPGFADPISSLSHLIAAGVFLALSLPLTRRGASAACHDAPSEGRRRIASLAIFALAAVLLLSMSGVFHLLPRDSTGRSVLLRLDHAAIFMLIAGTFTPTHTILFRGAWRWGMLLLVWGIAVASVTLKSIFFTGVPEWLGLTLYVAMGWIGLFSMVKLARTRGPRFIAPLLTGGIVYTLGAAMELANLRPLVPGVIRSHELFHAAVIVGLALHWHFIAKVAREPGPRAKALLHPTTATTSPTTFH